MTRDGSTVGVTENARLPSSVAAFSMPGKMNLQVIGRHDDLISQGVPMWRQTTTVYGGEEQQAAALFALTDDGLVQLAFAADRMALVLDPPLVVLPHHPEDGQQWTDRGDALGGLIDYRARSTAHREGECWRVVGSTSFVEHASGASMGSIPGESRLCPGRGIIDGTPARAPRPSDTGARPRAARHPLRQLTRATPLEVVSPSGIGDLPLTTLRLEVAPVGTADGRLVLADAGSRDLVSARPDGQQLTVEWRAHPGGTVTSLSALGDVVVAGTSDRDVCAYGADGGWLWCRQLGDLVDHPAVALDARTMAVLGQDGVLRALDVLTGKVRWRVRGVDTPLPPVRVGRRLVAVERDGTLRAWWSRNGRESWTTEATDPPSTLATSDGEILVGGLLATRYDARGRPRAQHVLRVSVDRTVLLGDTTVLSGPDGTAAYDRDGRRLWSAPRWRTTATDDAGILAVERDYASIVDPATGRTLTRLPLRERTGSWWVVPVGDERILVHSGATVVGLS